MNINIEQLTQTAVMAARAAGTSIMKVYQSSDFGLEYKADDSPLTEADKAAHEEIIQELKHTGLPILSEEGRKVPYEERKRWEYFWLVDPLDGTKEFVKRNGEFTVNIALIHKDKPIMGVLYAPVLDWMYWGNSNEGTWKQEGQQAPYQLKAKNGTAIKAIVVSLSHQSETTKKFMKDYPNVDIISMGSSLKFMLLAEDKAQLYPRFAPTMEWDTAAAHGILLSLGADILKFPENKSLVYNKENLLNPFFIAKTP
ncbi:3'(2'),5'-bisphosphate nucleotidase CysQ [Echinicola marina]|uniref:3'(2'),5'-bisphosphate nucleotidase CysQ n=1 Tax=Echinicola marina TaxID=2859768 RepID=UPI001CF6C31F|nr:3'(2'),5'-bisphosphate nucleotidase CysQ [Echinicola marina]UCS94940.1 3'(2'),5'-bisphosphate nucleotidase CysQ [Echinicola marina]